MKKDNEPPFKDLPESVKLYIEHLERVRQDFVANVSHELRTPLTVIQGYLESLLKHGINKNKSYDKIFSQMHQHSVRMSHIIEDLLLLAHLESDECMADEIHTIKIDAILKAQVTDAKNYSGANKHKIILSADKNVLLKGSEQELRSLFSNIIINAVKYTPPLGTIRIEWYRDDKQRGIFKVTDTGIGIEKHHIPKITERFYRIDKARSRESGGTGLGLAIAKHVLLRHHAELVIESELGKGSTFTCVFPADHVFV